MQKGLLLSLTMTVMTVTLFSDFFFDMTELHVGLGLGLEHRRAIRDSGLLTPVEVTYLLLTCFVSCRPLLSSSMHVLLLVSTLAHSTLLLLSLQVCMHSAH